MRAPYDPPTADLETPALEAKGESGYLLANFLICLACLAQLAFGVVSTAGIYAYVDASITGEYQEGYSGLIAPIWLLPPSALVFLAARAVLSAAKQKVYRPLRWSLWICSALPALSFVTSFFVPMVFDGPPLF